MPTNSRPKDPSRGVHRPYAGASSSLATLAFAGALALALNGCSGSSGGTPVSTTDGGAGGAGGGVGSGGGGGGGIGGMTSMGMMGSRGSMMNMGGAAGNPFGPSGGTGGSSGQSLPTTDNDAGQPPAIMESGMASAKFCNDLVGANNAALTLTLEMGTNPTRINTISGECEPILTKACSPIPAGTIPVRLSYKNMTLDEEIFTIPDGARIVVFADIDPQTMRPTLQALQFKPEAKCEDFPPAPTGDAGGAQPPTDAGAGRTPPLGAGMKM